MRIDVYGNVIQIGGSDRRAHDLPGHARRIAARRVRPDARRRHRADVRRRTGHADPVRAATGLDHDRPDGGRSDRLDPDRQPRRRARRGVGGHRRRPDGVTVLPRADVVRHRPGRAAVAEGDGRDGRHRRRGRPLRRNRDRPLRGVRRRRVAARRARRADRGLRPEHRRVLEQPADGRVGATHDARRRRHRRQRRAADLDHRSDDRRAGRRRRRRARRRRPHGHHRRRRSGSGRAGEPRCRAVGVRRGSQTLLPTRGTRRGPRRRHRRGALVRVRRPRHLPPRRDRPSHRLGAPVAVVGRRPPALSRTPATSATKCSTRRASSSPSGTTRSMRSADSTSRSTSRMAPTSGPPTSTSRSHCRESAVVDRAPVPDPGVPAPRVLGDGPHRVERAVLRRRAGHGRRRRRVLRRRAAARRPRRLAGDDPADVVPATQLGRLHVRYLAALVVVRRRRCRARGRTVDFESASTAGQGGGPSTSGTGRADGAGERTTSRSTSMAPTSTSRGRSPPRPRCTTSIARRGRRGRAARPRRLYVGLRTDRTFIEQGTPIRYDAVVTDVDGNLVPAARSR